VGVPAGVALNSNAGSTAGFRRRSSASTCPGATARPARLLRHDAARVQVTSRKRRRSLPSERRQMPADFVVLVLQMTGSVHQYRAREPGDENNPQDSSASWL
jgi:hypothetical protein